MDELENDVIDLAEQEGEIGVLAVQRAFGVGYARASHVLGALERHGILAPAENGKRKYLGYA